jgi:hypothetical protein
MSGEPNLVDALESLSQLACAVTSEEDAQGSLHSGKELRLCWICETFEYTEHGVKSQLKGTSAIKETWHTASLHVRGLLKDSEEWGSAVDVIAGILNDRERAERATEAFVSTLLRVLLEEEQWEQAALKRVVEDFSHELAGNPVGYRLQAEMGGLIMLGSPIQLTCEGMEISIRRTVQEDLETEETAFTSSGTHPASYPSAIVSLHSPSNDSGAVQEGLRRLEAALRLYEVGSVDVYSWQGSSTSLVDMPAGKVIHRKKPRPDVEKAILRDRDSERLTAFLKHIVPMVPDSFFTPNLPNPEPSAIAYTRYCDALFATNPYEYRMPNAIISLEALLLEAGGGQELSFKLCARAGRLLSHFGEDAVVIRDCLRLAYHIRSRYVHGGLASKKDNSKVLRAHGSIAIFSRAVLDCVRKVLLIMVQLPDAKDALLQAIDAAFVQGCFEDAVTKQLDALAEPPRAFKGHP